jgi:hypothetical protein
MPTFRGQILLGDSDAGWSETYWLDAATHEAAMTALDTICTARMALSTPDVEAKVLRVSAEGIKGDSFLKAATAPIGTYVATGVTALDPNTAMQVNAYNADHTAWTHWFIRGIPIDQVNMKIPASLLAAGIAPWPANLTAYLAALVAGAKLNTKKGDPVGTKKLVPIVSTGKNIPLVTRRAGRPFHLRHGRRVTV